MAYYYQYTPYATCMCAPTIPGVAINYLDTIPNLSPQERAILNQVKHSNDPRARKYGFNPYGGPVDHSAEALADMSKIVYNHKKHRDQKKLVVENINRIHMIIVTMSFFINMY